MDNLIKGIFVFVSITVVGIFGLGSFVGVVSMLLDNVPVTIKVDGKEVYSGPSYAAEIESSGATTKVKISGGYLYLFPKAYYVSNHVEVVGKK